MYDICQLVKSILWFLFCDKGIYRYKQFNSLPLDPYAFIHLVIVLFTPRDVPFWEAVVLTLSDMKISVVVIVVIRINNERTSRKDRLIFIWYKSKYRRRNITLHLFYNEKLLFIYNHHHLFLCWIPIANTQHSPYI